MLVVTFELVVTWGEWNTDVECVSLTSCREFLCAPAAINRTTTAPIYSTIAVYFKASTRRLIAARRELSFGSGRGRGRGVRRNKVRHMCSHIPQARDINSKQRTTVTWKSRIIGRSRLWDFERTKAGA